MYWLGRFIDVASHYIKNTHGSKTTVFIAECLLRLTNYDTVCVFKNGQLKRLTSGCLTLYFSDGHLTQYYLSEPDGYRIFKWSEGHLECLHRAGKETRICICFARQRIQSLLFHRYKTNLSLLVCNMRRINIALFHGHWFNKHSKFYQVTHSNRTAYSGILPESIHCWHKINQDQFMRLEPLPV